MKPNQLIRWVLVAALLGGCSESKNTAPGADTAAKHELHPPHGGTLVALGDEDYQVELVLDATTGDLQAYMFDGELENFIRIPAASIEINAQIDGHEEKLVLKAVANSATGETVGDTSMFEGKAEWLKTATSFDAVLKEITVRSKTYSDVKFNFPKGNDEAIKK